MITFTPTGFRREPCILGPEVARHIGLRCLGVFRHLADRWPRMDSGGAIRAGCGPARDVNCPALRSWGQLFSNASQPDRGYYFSGKFILRLGRWFIGQQSVGCRYRQAWVLGHGGPGWLCCFDNFIWGRCGQAFRVDRALGFYRAGPWAYAAHRRPWRFPLFLPKTVEMERRTVLVVVSVTILSTVAMILYPALLLALDWSEVEIAYVLGDLFMMWHKWWDRAPLRMRL